MLWYIVQAFLDHPVLSVWLVGFCWGGLECLMEDNMYFIVSPKDLVVARQRDLDDHLSWLLEHEMFEVGGEEPSWSQGSDLKTHILLAPLLVPWLPWVPQRYGTSTAITACIWQNFLL